MISEYIVELNFEKNSKEIEDQVTDVKAEACQIVFEYPMLAKSNVKALNNCDILQLHKSYLNEMRLFFKEELGILLAGA